MKRRAIRSDADEFKDNFRLEKRYLTEVMANNLAKLNFVNPFEEDTAVANTEAGNSVTSCSRSVTRRPPSGHSSYVSPSSYSLTPVSAVPHSPDDLPLAHFMDVTDSPRSLGSTSAELTSNSDSVERTAHSMPCFPPYPASSSRASPPLPISLFGSPQDSSPLSDDLRRCAILHSIELQRRTDLHVAESDTSETDSMISEECCAQTSNTDEEVFSTFGWTA
mmetsp:Transcript_5297/g.9186  ORF Transcript_5297/g.9186 Transcript_5297/m.9186 type:complete len:221 (-) Transcript_5297:516-1178(-)|eukprot:CAMPEP_0198198658 /NCGR_PEP_ID=MMETSP1445-20131203/2104_1 /TAXON_ID=36898 /ORGANISM="Pyramimonas sp., Strain CCMP2087" /LENGTH=220 /DNA_ID=CAMNT_0043868287 /DNA_START=149 /DNA_END=811 /DNA_ORIENTATION=+